MQLLLLSGSNFVLYKFQEFTIHRDWVAFVWQHRLEKYEEWGEPIKIDFERTVGKEIWEAHWFNCNMIQERMRKAQEHADKIKKLVDASPR